MRIFAAHMADAKPSRNVAAIEARQPGESRLKREAGIWKGRILWPSVS